MTEPQNYVQVSEAKARKRPWWAKPGPSDGAFETAKSAPFEIDITTNDHWALAYMAAPFPYPTVTIKLDTWRLIAAAVWRFLRRDPLFFEVQVKPGTFYEGPGDKERWGFADQWVERFRAAELDRVAGAQVLAAEVEA
jgi:hypothetical protein